MKLIRLFVFLLLSLCLALKPDFLSEQKKYERVKSAYTDKGKLIFENLKKEKINPDNLTLLIRAFKAEKKLEIFGKNKSENKYHKIATYDICSSSGILGPKRKQGDNQVPEGFYFINTFNPSSSYYLSLGINYPNKSDKIKSKANNLGGDIFIHGECVTIGCLPMTNDKIKEIYLYAIQARANGQSRIPVYIFPFKMTDENSRNYSLKNKNNSELISFWNTIKKGYDIFEKENKELNISIDKNGNYLF